MKTKNPGRFLLPIALVAMMAGGVTTQAQIRFQPGGYENSVVDTTVGVNTQSGEFATLIAALQAAGLVGILDAVGPVTVFAPTDAAFAQLGLNANNIGTAFSRGELVRILLNHVALGNLLSGDVLGTDKINVLSGLKIYPRQTQSGAFVVDADRTPARLLIEADLIDLQTDNGVIHVIDNVLLFPR